MRTQPDYQKLWQGILVGYSPDIRKHYCIWVPQTKEIVIASEPYIDKSKRDAKLLAKWLLDITQTQKKALAKEPKPGGRPRKNLIEACIKTLI